MWQSCLQWSFEVYTLKNATQTSPAKYKWTHYNLTSKNLGYPELNIFQCCVKLAKQQPVSYLQHALTVTVFLSTKTYYNTHLMHGLKKST